GALRIRLHLLPYCFHQLDEHALAVAHDRDVDLDVLRDGRRVDVDVDDLGGGREGVDAPGDAVVEARAHGHQTVRVVDETVRVVGAVHAQHVESERVGHGESPEPQQGMGHGDLGQLRQL